MPPDDPVTDDTIVRQQFDAIERGARAVFRHVRLRPDEVVVYEALASQTVSRRERPRVRLALFALLAVRDARWELGRLVPNASRLARLALQAGALAAKLGINLVTSAQQRTRGRASWRERRRDPARATEEAALRKAVLAARRDDPTVKDRAIARQLVPHISSPLERRRAIDRKRKQIEALDEKYGKRARVVS
jgi:hypothetical protein